MISVGAVRCFLLATKSNAFTIFKSFLAMIERQLNKKIKIIRSDNAWKLGSSSDNSKFFSSQGIIHQTSCVATPQQNGVVERKHKNLLEVCRALLFQSHLPNKLWRNAIMTATYLINRCPTKLFSYKTPYERLFHHPPTYSI